MTNHTAAPLYKPLLLLISLLQGLGLLVLHESVEYSFWPGTSFGPLFGLIAFALIAPTMLLLTLTRENGGLSAKWIASFSLLCAGLAYYVGVQATPPDKVESGGLIFTLVVTMGLASFKALMYIQQRAGRQHIAYGALFTLSWQNFLVLALGGLFTLVIFGLLKLWGGLFNIIGIDYFSDLFKQKWFLYPALSLGLGFGIILLRSQLAIISTIANIWHVLTKFLLVLLVFIALLFLLFLPFEGLSALWQTGKGSLLLLWLMALILFFINSVYQSEETNRAYPIWLHRFIYIGIACLPIYSVISFYGLSARVGQYGLTLERCWAWLIWGMLTLFAVGYCVGIIRKRDNWVAQLSKVNIGMGLVVLMVTLLVNSPLLDFRKISVNSQLARLDSGLVTIEEFDFHYFRNHLARPGYLALLDLKARYAESKPEVGQRIEELMVNRWSRASVISGDRFATRVEVYPQGYVLPAELLDHIYSYHKDDWQFKNSQSELLIAIDLNGDNNDEFVVIFNQKFSRYAFMHSKTDSGWQVQNLQAHNVDNKINLLEAIKANPPQAIEPKWKTLQIGELKFQVQ